jgi:predicted SprT family Zn-dependent metalloprotease
MSQTPPTASFPGSAADRLFQVRRWAEQVIRSFGLSGWTFRFNRRKRSLGICSYDRKVIELSMHFVDRNDATAIRDTLLHEIAHALVGPGHGHDAVWKRKCVEIGALPQRCCRTALMPAGRWQASCGTCGTVFHRHRKPKRMAGWHCVHCGRDRGKLTWRDVVP